MLTELFLAQPLWYRPQLDACEPWSTAVPCHGRQLLAVQRAARPDTQGGHPRWQLEPAGLQVGLPWLPPESFRLLGSPTACPHILSPAPGPHSADIRLLTKPPTLNPPPPPPPQRSTPVDASVVNQRLDGVFRDGGEGDGGRFQGH